MRFQVRQALSQYSLITQRLLRAEARSGLVLTQSCACMPGSRNLHHSACHKQQRAKHFPGTKAQADSRLHRLQRCHRIQHTDHARCAQNGLSTRYCPRHQQVPQQPLTCKAACSLAACWSVTEKLQPELALKELCSSSFLGRRVPSPKLPHHNVIGVSR